MTFQAHEDTADSTGSRVRERLFEAGALLPPDVEARILAYGDAVVAPLIQIVEDRDLLPVDAPGEGYAPMHAANILAKLGAVEAIPALIDLLLAGEADEICFSAAAHSLVAMGAAALEPVLRAHAVADPGSQRALESVLAELGARDDRILEILLRRLEEDPEEAAFYLAMYGDSRAVEHLSRAFDQQALQMETSACIELYDAILRLGGSLTAEQKQAYDQVCAACRPMPRQIPWRADPSRAPSQSTHKKRQEARKRRAARKRQKASRRKNRG